MNSAPSSTASQLDRPHASVPFREVCFSDIEDAAQRLRGSIAETPCTPLPGLGTSAGVTLHVKRDYLQATGSFKERGAANVLGCLSPLDRRRGIVAASAGNHALGLALHGARLGVPVTLVMPVNAARVKVDRCRNLGANVILFGETFDQADVEARLLAAAGRCRFVHPIDDSLVIAGQGTMGLEILRQYPEVEAGAGPRGMAFHTGAKPVLRASTHEIRTAGPYLHLLSFCLPGSPPEGRYGAFTTITTPRRK
jgi:threonine dehydratase